MNQKIASPDFNAASVSPRTTPPPADTAPPKDLGLPGLLAAMMEGENALAKRKDIGELHKRLIAALTTMNSGLSEAQAMRVAEDRKQISEKLEEVERAINSMEGALRIELEPMLRNILIDATEQHHAPKRSFSRKFMSLSFVFSAGLFFGSIYQPWIEKAYLATVAAAASYIQHIPAALPPKGGI